LYFGLLTFTRSHSNVRNKLVFYCCSRFVPPPGYHAEDVFFSRAVQLLNARPAEDDGTVAHLDSQFHDPVQQPLIASPLLLSSNNDSIISSSLLKSRKSSSSSSRGSAGRVVEAYRANLSLSLLLQMRALGRPLVGPYNSSSSIPTKTDTATATAAGRVAEAAIHATRQRDTTENDDLVLWSTLPSEQEWAAALRKYPSGKRLEPLPFPTTRVPPLHVALAFALRAGPGKGSHGAWRSRTSSKNGSSNSGSRNSGSSSDSSWSSEKEGSSYLPLPLGFHQCESYPSNPLPSADFVSACHGVDAILGDLQIG